MIDMHARCKGQQMSAKVVNSGVTNYAGFQWLSSGSRVARGGPAGFVPIVAKHGLKSAPEFVLPTFCQGRNPAEIITPPHPPRKHICRPP